MKNDIVYNFLEIFFKLLDEKLISYGLSGKIAIGIVTGITEEVQNLQEHQNFVHFIKNKDLEYENMITLCSYLYNKNLIDADRIIISEEQILENAKELGWNYDQMQKTVDDLLSIEIKMIDEGEETDSFFIHF